MAGKIKRIFACVVLIICVLNNLGCAVAWFLVGAGTAATVISVEKDKGDKSDETDETDEEELK